MRFIFLGTGTSQGIPVIGCTCEVCLSTDLKNHRLRCSAIIQSEKAQILVDGGPDLRQQLLRSQIHHLDAVFLTHEHYDHTGGLDDLRPIIFSRNSPLPIHATPEVQRILRIKYDYAFSEQKYPGAPQFDLKELTKDHSVQIEDVLVRPLAILHGDLPILGFVFNNSLAYITDANYIPDSSLAQIFKIDTLVINALHQRPHHAHFTLDQTLQMIKIIQPKQAYLIHMSHYMGLHDVVQTSLPQGVFLAYDQLEFSW